MYIFQKVDRLFHPHYLKLPERNLDELKQMSRILFVDDRAFNVVQILKNAGWIYTDLVKDVTSLDDPKIAEAHIIFVDILGVGHKLKFKDEGLGLITALRQKYPYKKLVVYSAESTGDRFHKGLSDADASLPKNADPFQFQTLIEEYSREAFSLAECVARLQKLLRTEFSIVMSEAQINKLLLKLLKRKDYSIETVGKVFNLQNAANVAQIASLFFTAQGGEQ